MTSTTSGGRPIWSAARSPRPASTWRTRTWSDRTSRPSGSPKRARTCADRSPTCWMSAAPAPAWNSCPRSASGSPAPPPRPRAAIRVRAVLAGMTASLATAPWWRDGWIDDAVSQAPQAFDDACRRWRDMYKLALQEFHAQSARSVDVSVPHKERDNAARRARDARIQLTLLSNEDSDDFQTDFYSYRYFASEGFLPGYSFPRLPLAAYIPGLAGRREGDYIQRPRFIGIGEFGPGAVI